MTNLVRLLLFVFGCLLAPTQHKTYIVMRVGGQAHKPRQPFLKFRDQLTDKDTVLLRTRDSYVIVLNQDGEYEISLRDTADHPGKWYELLVRDNLHLVAESRRLSSRNPRGPIDFTQCFKANPAVNAHVLFVDTLKIRLEGSPFPQQDGTENFLFLQLNRNDSVFNHKLNVINDTLQVSQQDFIFNGQSCSEQSCTFSLGFAEGSSGPRQVRLIADIQPVFLSQSQLRSFIFVIYKTMSAASEQDLQAEIYDELYYNFGRPDAVMPLVSTILHQWRAGGR
jgi:hypothetical protein